ncbi:uncharacterized protein LOC111103847 isoform X1 [Crassostrea virginica]
MLGAAVFLSVLGVTSTAAVSCNDVSTDACRLLVAAAPNFCTTPQANVECPSFCGLCSLGVTAAAGSCSDISTDACRLLVAASPNFCTTPSAQTECPAFCGLCTRTCYHCNEVNDPSTCTTSVNCGVGKECIVSETIGDDFIYHYNLGCVDKSYCTSGTDLPHPGSGSSVVGKRSPSKRNLQYGCCDADLCNNKMPAELTPTTCPTGTQEFKDGLVHVCYFLLKQERNADDGAKACANQFRGGNLAYIPSRAADNFIKSSFGSEFSGDHSGTFIGVFDKEHELSFVDTDGSPQIFFDWRHGQPNDPNVNDPNREPAQDCVRMFPIDGEHYTWQDKPCEQLAWSLCSINIHK